jgi:DNA-binding response OmpR family regulator
MSAINPLLMLIEDLLARVDQLEGQVHDLELALHLDSVANVQAAFDISETLAQLLIMLADGKPRNKERLHAALYYRRPDIDAPDTKIMDGLVCKLRKHVEPFGVQISTVWGNGYRLTAGLDVVRAAAEFADATVVIVPQVAA